MARHNFIQLFGKINGSPRIMKDDSTGQYIRGMCYIEVVRGSRNNGTDISEMKYDRILLITGDENRIREMNDLQENDIVIVKGAITTRNLTKSVTCEHCGEKSKFKGEMTFVTPIYIGKMYSGLNENEAYEVIRKNGEISNCAFLIGYLCNDVNYYSDRKIKMASYQIAVNRKFYLSDDNPMTSTDYPHIISYGSRAKDDKNCIHESSMILVDGALQSRSFQRNSTCQNEKCGEEICWEEDALEVIAYSTEYLQNYTTEDELKEREAQENKEAVEKIFGPGGF